MRGDRQASGQVCNEKNSVVERTVKIFYKANRLKKTNKKMESMWCANEVIKRESMLCLNEVMMRDERRWC